MGFVKKIGKGIKKAAKATAKVAKTAVNAVADAAKAAGEWALKHFLMPFEELIKLVKNIIGKVKNLASSFQIIWSFIKDVPRLTTVALNEGLDLIKKIPGLIEHIYEGVVDIAEDVGKSIKEIAEEVKDIILDALEKLEIVPNTIVEVGEKIGEIATDVYDEVKEFIEDVPPTLINFIKDNGVDLVRYPLKYLLIACAIVSIFFTFLVIMKLNIIIKIASLGMINLFDYSLLILITLIVVMLVLYNRQFTKIQKKIVSFIAEIFEFAFDFDFDDFDLKKQYNQSDFNLSNLMEEAKEKLNLEAKTIEFNNYFTSE